MKSSNLIFIVGLIFILLTDTIFWIQLKQYLNKKWQILLYRLHTLFFICALFLFQYSISRLKGPGSYFWIEKLIGLLFLFYTPKLIYIVFNGIGLLLRRRCQGISKLIRLFSGILAGALFLILLYSLTLGRYNYKIETINLTLENLPAEFDNFKIVQLSDIHLGSFGESYPGMRKLVGEINRLQPDIIVFTGDMVNNFAAEMLPWITLFQEMKASYGKYAITGNHDYGDYTRWPTEADKRNNLNQFFEHMKSMGFHMLNNDRIPIIEGRDTLWLAGVENWGNPPFPRYGKLDVAIDSLPGQACIILLSHDPSHWRGEILQVPRIALTLSGHTHAMQFGIKVGKNEWSPAQYIYPEYDGLYRHQNQYLYVSRGQGYLGFPGRIGLRPVITEFILHPNR